MKYFTAVILLIALTSVVPAQTQPTTPSAPTVVTTVQVPPITTTVTIPATPMKIVPFPGDKMNMELFAPGARKVFKNAPFSAEGISESTQTLEDGNRIRRSVTTKMYRDSEGRFRRESTGSTGGGTGFSYSTYGGVVSTYGFKDTISIFDPVAGVSYVLNPTDKTARTFSVQPGKFTFNMTGPMITPAIKAQIEAKVAEAKIKQTEKTETQVQVKPNVVVVPNVSGTGMGIGVGGGGVGYTISGGGVFTDNSNSKTESLGVRSFEGVEAEGSRTVTTIEAGKIGNERPIEITYERWFSKELDMIVYSRNYDPRFGEQIYKLVNISRSEPDSSLFTVPSDYKITTTAMPKVFVAPTQAPTKQQ